MQVSVYASNVLKKLLFLLAASNLLSNFAAGQASPIFETIAEFTEALKQLQKQVEIQVN